MNTLTWLILAVAVPISCVLGTALAAIISSIVKGVRCCFSKRQLKVFGLASLVSCVSITLALYYFPFSLGVLLKISHSYFIFLPKIMETARPAFVLFFALFMPFSCFMIRDLQLTSKKELRVSILLCISGTILIVVHMLPLLTPKIFFPEVDKLWGEGNKESERIITTLILLTMLFFFYTIALSSLIRHHTPRITPKRFTKLRHFLDKPLSEKGDKRMRYSSISAAILLAILIFLFHDVTWIMVGVVLFLTVSIISCFSYLILWMLLC